MRGNFITLPLHYRVCLCLCPCVGELHFLGHLFGYRPCAVTLYFSSSMLSGLAVPLPVHGKTVICTLSGRCCHCPCVPSVLWLI
ncbi:hypothetical protein EDB89DRAFT_2028441, partial [Lactarius sanguifluus]